MFNFSPMVVAVTSLEFSGSRNASEALASNHQILEALSALPSPPGGVRCWDGVDRLLLEAVVQLPDVVAARNGGETNDVLIINDEHGALAKLLSKREFTEGFGFGIGRIESYGDDIVSFDRSKDLLGTHDGVVEFVPSTNIPKAPAIVLLRIVASFEVLRAQITLLRSLRDSGARFVVVAAGLDRSLPPKTKALLGALGETHTLPGAHKAHAFICQADLVSLSSAAPKPSVKAVTDSASEIICTIAGVTHVLETGPYAFSGGRLDLGSRLLIEAVTASPTLACTTSGRPGRVADLACGNGVVGIAAHQAHPGTTMYFCDASFAAVALAERNATRYAVGPAEFAVDDGFSRYHGPRFDAVLLNPPFHKHGDVDEALGEHLFVHAHRHLRIGGELWVVGNRHLGYQKILHTMFGNCRLVTAHPKFVVLVAKREATRLMSNLDRSPRPKLERTRTPRISSSQTPQENTTYAYRFSAK